MYVILKPFSLLLDFSRRCIDKFVKQPLCKSILGYCGKDVEIRLPITKSLSRVYLYDHSRIMHGFKIISVTGKFIMKENSGAADGLTVITGNHQRIPGHLIGKFSGSHIYDDEKDVVVEEDVWIGANVTLLAGVTIGRGATIGAGSVVRNDVPPYSIVTGNPAKVVGFAFTPNIILEHEELLYPEEKRLPEELLIENFNKYFTSRINEIKEHLK